MWVFILAMHPRADVASGHNYSITHWPTEHCLLRWTLYLKEKQVKRGQESVQLNRICCGTDWDRGESIYTASISGMMDQLLTFSLPKWMDRDFSVIPIGQQGLFNNRYHSLFKQFFPKFLANLPDCHLKLEQWITLRRLKSVPLLIKIQESGL